MAILAALTLVTVAAPAIASHDGGCNPESSDPAVGGDGAGIFFETLTISVYEPVAETAGTVVVYVDTNGVPGIQRGPQDPFASQDDACGHGPDPLLGYGGCRGELSLYPLGYPSCGAGTGLA